MWLSEFINPSDPKGRDLKIWGSSGKLVLSPPPPPPPLLVSVHIEAAQQALESGDLTERERRHVWALLAYAEGDLPRATCLWADILIRHPRDLIAVRILFVSCIMIGEFTKMRNVLAGILPHWSRDMPCYPFILGL